MSDTQATLIAAEATATQPIKCVVWDLDNTVWNGTLLEDSSVDVFPNVVEIIKTLDGRGILQSIASRNDHDTAMAKLEAVGIRDYFLYPQINWNSKASSIQEIAKHLNISLDTFAFVDDQPFEREEVAFVLPQLRCYDAAAVDELPDVPAMNPRFITQDSRLRRSMYMSDIARDDAEHEFAGTNEAFLATLGMTFTIARAQEDDLQRAEELTMRTHQLNSTGYTYSYDELNAFCTSDRHRLYVSTLEDKYGTYGKIGLTLIECEPDVWTLKLLLMSCRVMSRGVGTVMLNYVMAEASKAGVQLRAEFVSNKRNRMMYIAYKFGGFNEVEKRGDVSILENDLSQIQPFPDYINMQIVD